MKMDHGKILKKSLKFAVKPERWLPFFIVDFMAATTTLFYVLFNVAQLLPLITETSNIAMLGGLIQSALVLLVIFVVWVLVRLWLQASLIHQSYKEKEYNKSFSIGLKKFPSVLAAIILIGLVSGLASIIPFVGWILSIIVGLIFFFALQVIVVNNKGFYESIMKSYNIFKKRAFDVFIVYLLLSVISSIIVLIFAIPSMILFYNVLILLVQSSAGGATMPLLSYIANMSQAYLPVIIMTTIVCLIGFAIANVFSLKAQTEFYLKMRK